MHITDCGRAAAVSVQGQRDLVRRAAAYPDLFPAGPFDAALYGGIAMANAFSAPWLPARRLRVANRMALWAFAVDRLVDEVATSRIEVRRIVASCVATSSGAVPDDSLTRSLAEIRDEMVAAPAYPAVGEVWRTALLRTLAAMAREWSWRAGGIRPTLADYLANADNVGFALVFAAHWVATEPAAAYPGAPDPMAAARGVQRAIRLVNDLGTYPRDLVSGDLNVLRLGLDRLAARAHLTELVTAARADIATLDGGVGSPVGAGSRLAMYLRRQLEFNMGFHPVSDYWGEDAESPIPAGGGAA